MIGSGIRDIDIVLRVDGESAGIFKNGMIRELGVSDPDFLDQTNRAGLVDIGQAMALALQGHGDTQQSEGEPVHDPHLEAHDSHFI
jgi:hypothetical protein